MTNYLTLFASTVAIARPQTRPAAHTMPNAAAGYAYAIDDGARLDRFLTIGSEDGSYCAGERVLSRDNA